MTYKSEFNYVLLWEAEQEAECIGEEYFEPFDITDPESISPTEHGRFDTHILPKLRQLAGYQDAGHGTYQVPEMVFLIEDPDDETGKLVDPCWILDDLVEAYERGAYNMVDD